MKDASTALVIASNSMPVPPQLSMMHSNSSEIVEEYGFTYFLYTLTFWYMKKVKFYHVKGNKRLKILCKNERNSEKRSAIKGLLGETR